jgi:hypothetical protein
MTDLEKMKQLYDEFGVPYVIQERDQKFYVGFQHLEITVDKENEKLSGYDGSCVRNVFDENGKFLWLEIYGG